MEVLVLLLLLMESGLLVPNHQSGPDSVSIACYDFESAVKVSEALQCGNQPSAPALALSNYVLFYRRTGQPVPKEFTAPLELQQQHFGLVDDYGIKPKHFSFRTRASRKESKELQKTHKSKRDEPDFEEYYYDDIL